MNEIAHSQSASGRAGNLETSSISRIGDVLANHEEYQEADEWIGSVINQLDLTRSYSIREFLSLMGRELSEIAHEDGILTSAFKSRVPRILMAANVGAGDVGSDLADVHHLLAVCAAHRNDAGVARFLCYLQFRGLEKGSSRLRS